MRPSTAFPSSLLFLFLASVRAQDQGGNSSSSDPSAYASQCVTALQSAGFSGLAETLSKINTTQPGQQLFAQLSSGKNFTVFAPDNNAIQQLPAEVSQNTTLLAEYISYHFVDGDLTNTSYTNSSSGGGAGGGGASSSSSMPMSTSTSEGGAESSTTTTTTGGGGGGETPTATPSSAALFGRHFALLPRQDGGGGGDQGGNGSQGGGGGGGGGGMGGGNNGSSPGGGGGGSSGGSPQPYAGVWPNVTVGRTLLNASDLVMLEGNKSQVLAWTRYSPDGNVTFLNQAQNITVENSTTWQNLFINAINGTLAPPGNLTTALAAINATALESVLGSVQVPSNNGTNETVVEALQNSRGITVFVPANVAFTSDVNSTLQGLQSNTTALRAIIENHYLNGTTLYSTQVDNTTTATTAAGEPLQFIKNDTGTYVTGANSSSAKIIRPDVLLENGVAHVVDQVFLVGESNPSEAASAFSSASAAAAAQTTTETGTVGVVAGGGGGGQSTQAPESSSTQSSSESSSTQSSSSESTSQTSSSEQPSSTSSESGSGETSSQFSGFASPTSG